MIAVYLAIIIILIAFFVSQSMNKNQKISSKSICVICNEIFEEDSIIESDGLSFCQAHFKDYKSSEWVIIDSCECSPGQEEQSVELYHKKIKYYEEGHLGFLRPSYKEVNNKIITTLDYYQKKSPTK